MRILGIDPGLGGALALLGGSVLRVHDMPTIRIERAGKNRRELDLHALARLVAACKPCTVVLEKAGAHPRQGVTSMFSFGRAFGAVEAMVVANGLPLTYVAPQTWKKDLGVPKGKDGARQRASDLLPAFAGQWARRKDDGRAEAVLLACWFGTRRVK